MDRCSPRTVARAWHRPNQDQLRERKPAQRSPPNAGIRDANSSTELPGVHLPVFQERARMVALGKGDYHGSGGPNLHQK